MRKAYCTIRIGDWKQTVYIKDDFFSPSKIQQVPMSHLPEFFAKDETLEKVYLSGAPINFLQHIEKETKEKEKTLYSNKQPITFIYSQI